MVFFIASQTKICTIIFNRHNNFSNLFASLKFTKPLWYFHLDCGDDVIWPYSNNIIPPQNLDLNYESTQSTASEASYIALIYGHIHVSPDKGYLSKEIVNYKHSPYDEFRFLRKFFNPFWSVGYLIYRLVTLKSIFKSVIAFIKTFFFIKRVNIKDISFGRTELRLENPIKFLENKTKVRIIIPTYNRYNVLYNLLKDLERQNYSEFYITIIDQSEKFNKDFYKNFNLRIDLVRQEIPRLWKARNNAIKNTNEKVIALLDDDSRINNDWLIKHLNCLEYFNSEISAGVSLSKLGAKIPFNYKFYRISDQIDTGNVVLSRRIFKISGLFDEQFEGMRMGDAEFGLRAYRNGITSISNPEAFRIHLKSKQGGLRKFGSWDAFRPTSFLKPRPIPSVLYYARKNFDNYSTLVYLLINLPLSLSKYSKKTDPIFTFISFLLFLFIFPIILLQTFNSWKISSSILSEGDKIPNEK